MRALLACLALAGCTEPTPRRRAFRVEAHPSLGIAVSIFDDGKLEARTLETGELRFELVHGAAREVGYGSFPPSALYCPTRAMPERGLLVANAAFAIVFDVDTGRRRATRRRRLVSGRAPCPTVTRAGELVEAWPAYHGSGHIVKLDAAMQQELWRLEVPDIGPLVGALELDPESGDILALSDTHTMAVTDGGQIRWIHPNAHHTP